TDGHRLDSAAHVLTLPLARAPKLVQGERLVLPEGPVPDVSVWAFDARTGETSPVIDGPRASYVFRLDSLEPAGVPPLAPRCARGSAVRSSPARRGSSCYRGSRGRPSIRRRGASNAISSGRR